MKKLNIILGFALLFSFVLAVSSFTNESKPMNQGNGNIVTIDNGQTWYWIADNCIAPWVPSTNARVQTASSGFLNITLNFQLPAGHCDIPANGAVVKHYSDDAWAVINSNGKVNAKIVFNPNGN